MNTEFTPVQTSPYSIGYKIKSRLWSFVNATFFRWTPWFMRRTRIAILKIFGAKVEWSCSISGGAEIVDPWNLTMGHLSSIDKDCYVLCRDKITIGAKTCIGRGVYLLPASHNVSSPNFEMITAPIIIGNNVWIATKAMINKGLRIGDGAVIASYANVIKSVDEWTIVGGHPAKFIKKREITKTNDTRL